VINRGFQSGNVVNKMAQKVVGVAGNQNKKPNYR